MLSKLINKFKRRPLKAPMTAQESENIDLAEKGIDSPLNPSKDGMKADVKDQETVLKSVKKKPVTTKTSTQKTKKTTEKSSTKRSRK